MYENMAKSVLWNLFLIALAAFLLIVFIFSCFIILMRGHLTDRYNRAETELNQIRSHRY